MNERRSKGPVPFAVGFYFGFRVITVVVFARGLGADPRTGPEINVAVSFLLLLVTAFCCIGQVQYPFRKMADLPEAKWLLLFLGFSVISLLWSSTASLADSLAYWCAMAADISTVALLLRAEPFLDVSESLMRGFVWGAVAVAIVAWIIPAQSDLRLGDDELLGPNQIGYICALAFFFAQYLMRQKKKGFGAAALFLALTMFRALSKTTIVAFLVGEGFLLIRDKSISRKSKVLLILTVALALAVFWQLLSSYYAFYASAGNQSETLSGRFGIWAIFLTEAIQQPWIGHGLDSAWKVISPFGPDQFEPAHAHNELLQQFYAYGAVGVCMFLGIYGSFYRHIRRLVKGPQKTYFLALLLFILVRGLADTERIDLSLPLWAVLMLSMLVEHARSAETSESVSQIEVGLKLPVTALIPIRNGS